MTWIIRPGETARLNRTVVNSDGAILFRTGDLVRIEAIYPTCCTVSDGATTGLIDSRHLDPDSTPSLFPELDPRQLELF
jgi:hypothetical protein